MALHQSGHRAKACRLAKSVPETRDRVITLHKKGARVPGEQGSLTEGMEENSAAVAVRAAWAGAGASTGRAPGRSSPEAPGEAGGQMLVHMDVSRLWLTSRWRRPALFVRASARPPFGRSVDNGAELYAEDSNNRAQTIACYRRKCGKTNELSATSQHLSRK